MEEIIIYKCGHILAIENIPQGKYIFGKRVAAECPVCQRAERYQHGLP